MLPLLLFPYRPRLSTMHVQLCTLSPVLAFTGTAKGAAWGCVLECNSSQGLSPCPKLLGLGKKDTQSLFPTPRGYSDYLFMGTRCTLRVCMPPHRLFAPEEMLGSP